jgi:hypothetical protein
MLTSCGGVHAPQLLCLETHPAECPLDWEADQPRGRVGGGAAAGAPRVLHVCGDSHSLAPSWRRLSVHGAPLLLKSALVTGMKHWHLRPSSKFYPKANFYQVPAYNCFGVHTVFSCFCHSLAIH